MHRSFLPGLALVLALASVAGAAGAQPAALPNAPVPALDLQRYAGDWHEIARLPMFFERNCVANVTASDTPRADGTLGVRNACDGGDGTRRVSEGTARPVAGHPGQLQVRFAPGWLAWLPLAWADYWVVELDLDYRWAVVGGAGHDQLWVLSRAPRMERATFEAIRARAARRGYPVERLVLPAGTLD